MTTTTSSSYITHLRFVHAMAIVRAIPQNSTLQPVAADKLQFYGLYKQATEGDGNKPRPSSRQVVEYAKWKAWNRMKGISPIEAQKLYVESLIHLLTELVHRYPHHEQSSFLKKALYSLEHDTEEEEDEELYQDAYDSTEFELQEHFLNNIEPDQLRRQDIYSPPATPGNSSFRSTPTAHIRSSSYYNNHRHNSISDISHTDYPITPITSPGQNSVTGQWVLNQLQQSNASKTSNYVHPMDFLQQQQTDTLSEADTIDREVAATTANLTLSSPRQSPYSGGGGDTKKKSSHSSRLSSSSTSSKKKKKDNTRALERLQTEVTALTEQIDRLRRSSVQEKNDRKRWTASRACMVLIKHLMANSAILIIAFYILWRKKSPIAYSVIDYIRPLMLDLLRKIIRRIVFWKITV